MSKLRTQNPVPPGVKTIHDLSSSYEGGYANQTMNTLQVRNQRNDINMTVDDVDYGDTTSMTQNNK